MSLRKQVRSKEYMDEVFEALELGVKSRYGRQEFAELASVINVKFVGGVGTADAIDNAIAVETPTPTPTPTSTSTPTPTPSSTPTPTPSLSGE